VFADASKRRLLQLLDLPQEQLALLTDDPHAALLHVAHMAPPDPTRLAAAYVDKPGSPWKRVVAFRPTGAALLSGLAPAMLLFDGELDSSCRCSSKLGQQRLQCHAAAVSRQAYL
jgi:hypothetical protein